MGQFLYMKTIEMISKLGTMDDDYHSIDFTVINAVVLKEARLFQSNLIPLSIMDISFMILLDQEETFAGNIWTN